MPFELGDADELLDSFLRYMLYFGGTSVTLRPAVDKLSPTAWESWHDKLESARERVSVTRTLRSQRASATEV